MTFPLRVCAALLICLLSEQSVSAAEPVGAVLAAKTEVSSAGSGGERTLGPSDPIFFMDRLSTNETGIGEFMFEDGTKLALGPSASLVVDQFVQKNRTTFSNFGLAATKGTFRWISGSSPSTAYRITTPVGSMSIRGTALDGTTLNGITHLVLLNGEAEFCVGSTCRVLNRSGDYISTSSQGISPTRDIKTVFSNRGEAAKIFPFLADPRLLSAQFRVPGSNLLSDLALGDTGNLGANQGGGAGGNAGGSGGIGGAGGALPIGIAATTVAAGSLVTQQLIAEDDDDDDDDRPVSPN